MTLLPGLIDLHTHLTGDLSTPDWVAEPVRGTPASWALRGAKNARITLRAGFTTVRDVGAGGFSDVALMRAIDAGFIPGPRVVPSGHAIGITGGHCDVTGWAPGVAEQGPEGGVADGPESVTRAVRYQIKHGAKVIKLCATAGVLSFEGSVGAQQMDDEEIRAAVREAARHGIPVAAHAHGAEGILAAVRAGVTSIEHGSILTPQVVAAMKQRGTWLVPTLYLREAIRRDLLPPPIRAKMDEVTPLMDQSFRLALRSGVKIAFGTDASVYPHGQNAREFAVRVKLGQTPLEAIRGATRVRRPGARRGRPRRHRAGEARGPRRGERRPAARHRGARAGRLRDEGGRGAEPAPSGARGRRAGARGAGRGGGAGGADGGRRARRGGEPRRGGGGQRADQLGRGGRGFRRAPRPSTWATSRCSPA